MVAALVMAILVAAGIWKYSLGLKVQDWRNNKGNDDLDRKLLSSILHAGLWAIASFVIGYSTSIAFTIADHQNAGCILTILGGCFFLFALVYGLFTPILTSITEAAQKKDYNKIEKIYFVKIGVTLIVITGLYCLINNNATKILEIWLGKDQITTTNLSILYLGFLYSSQRAIGIPAALMIIANNQQKNNKTAAILESLVSICMIALALNHIKISYIFIGLTVGSILSFASIMLTAFRNPNIIGFKTKKTVVLSLLINLFISGVVLTLIIK
jgi:hypothetical protein